MTQRLDVEFRSGDSNCAAWLYLPEEPADTQAAGGRFPVVVMAHGLGGTREARLDAFAEQFCAAGLACLVFDYRHFGASGGTPRQLLSVRRQLADWSAALEFVRARPDLDPARIALWGTSFSGGHVIAVAAKDKAVAALVSQCPFTDGLASGTALNPLSTVKVGVRAVPDLIGGALRARPITVPLVGPAGSGALMTSHDALKGYMSLRPDPSEPVHRVAARIGVTILGYRPGRKAKSVTCPALFVLCEKDTVAPVGPTRRYAQQAPLGEIAQYPYGHFEIYLGEPFEEVVAKEIDFLRTHLRVPVRQA